MQKANTTAPRPKIKTIATGSLSVSDHESKNEQSMPDQKSNDQIPFTKLDQIVVKRNEKNRSSRNLIKIKSDENPITMSTEDKVKTNLFGLGSHKDVSSEMFNKDQKPTEEAEEKGKITEVKDEYRLFGKQRGKIIIKTITNAQESVTIFDEKQSTMTTNLREPMSRL